MEKWYNFFLNFVEVTRKPSEFGAFFFGRLFISNSISLIDTGLFRLSISPHVNLVILLKAGHFVLHNRN